VKDEEWSGILNGALGETKEKMAFLGQNGNLVSCEQ